MRFKTYISYDFVMNEPINRLAKQHEAIMIQLASGEIADATFDEIDMTKAIANCFVSKKKS